MKKNKGFTLVELLAVIAILAILVIIALPNVMGMFNEAKKSSFTTELKEVYKVAQQQWMMDSMTSTGDQVYSRCKTCTGKSLQLSGRSELDYYIKIDKAGKAVKYYATDGTYQFSYDGPGLLVENIKKVDTITDLTNSDIITISDDGINDAINPNIASPVSFSTDSWETIVNALKKGNDAVYHIGDTKTIDMGSLGTHTIRIANKSTPDECKNAMFSKTACGFVIEFTDIIINKSMFTRDHNYGGWRDSLIRSYLNSDFLNALPSDLSNIIESTYTVSGFGSDDTENFQTYDKLFLLSPKEVWGTESTTNIVESDTGEADTRQLDYYKNNGVTTTNYSKAVKKLNDSAATWLLRTPCRGDNDGYYGVQNNGNWTILGAGRSYGVSPAFKLKISTVN